MLALIFASTVIGRLVTAGSAAPTYDAIIKNGLVVDGTGSTPRRLDVGIRADRITYIGNLQKAEAAVVVDANGLAVAPGFINMLSWAVDDLIADGRSSVMVNTVFNFVMISNSLILSLTQQIVVSPPFFRLLVRTFTNTFKPLLFR